MTESICGHVDRALDSYSEYRLLQLVCEKPGVYLREIVSILREDTGMEWSKATICRALKRFGYTRKKVRFVAKQRSELLRAEYKADISAFHSSMLVFIDETGCDKRDSLRKFGYALRGLTPKSVTLLSRGKRVSAIVAISTTKLLDYDILEGTDNGDDFYEFVQVHLPYLLPYNGTNPNSVVVWDNCTIHHTSDVVQLINSVGALVTLLPYSPDLTPAEEAFSKVKSILRSCEDVYAATANQPVQLISGAFELPVTSSDCQGWAKDCGYIC